MEPCDQLGEEGGRLEEVKGEGEGEDEIGKIGGEVTKAMGKREEESEKGETRKKRKIKKEREK